MTEPWTRNHKLTLTAIIVTIVLGFSGLIVKTNIEVNILNKELNELKADYAEIRTLKAKVAEIDKLLAGETRVGKFTSKCPEGQIASTVVSSRGLEVVCK